MKKKASRARRDPDMPDEYDFSKGVRGKYAGRYASGTNLVKLDPEIAEVFPDSRPVNEALRGLVEIARRAAKTAK